MTTTAKRKAIDDFLNPVPISASKMLENEGIGEDDGNHMQSFFKQSTQSEVLEMNRRSIMPEIQITGKAYEAKKVTRKQLDQQSSGSASNIDASGSSEMEEEGEEEMTESDLQMPDIDKE